MRTISEDESLEIFIKESAEIVERLNRSLPSHLPATTFKDVSENFKPERIIGKLDRRIAVEALVLVLKNCSEYTHGMVHDLARWLDNPRWYESDNELRYLAIDTCLGLFEAADACRTDCIKQYSHDIAIDHGFQPVWWMRSMALSGAAFALDGIFQPKNRSQHVRYFARIKAIIENRDNGFSRQLVVRVFSRMRDESVNDLIIELLKDPEVLHESIPAASRLKLETAIPLLEKIITGDGFDANYSQSYFRGAIEKARRALKKLKSL